MKIKKKCNIQHIIKVYKKTNLQQRVLILIQFILNVIAAAAQWKLRAHYIKSKLLFPQNGAQHVRLNSRYNISYNCRSIFNITIFLAKATHFKFMWKKYLPPENFVC